MNLNDACRCLGYWGTGSGNMTATKRVVRQKIIAARDLIKCHPLTPELATKLFISKGMGVFYFSPGLIEWSENDGASKPTRTLGTCHGKQHALSLSSRKYMQVRKAHCTWQYWHRSCCCMPRDACDMRMCLKKSCWHLNCTLDEWLCDSFVELIPDVECKSMRRKRICW